MYTLDFHSLWMKLAQFTPQEPMSISNPLHYLAQSDITKLPVSTYRVWTYSTEICSYTLASNQKLKKQGQNAALSPNLTDAVKYSPISSTLSEQSLASDLLTFVSDLPLLQIFLIPF